MEPSSQPDPTKTIDPPLNPDTLANAATGPAAAGESAENVPHQVSEYRVEGVLGRGGMGVVYLAHDPGLNRQVALKVMHPQLAANPRAKARFVREAQAQAALDHDHVATIHAVGEFDTQPFFVMPLLKGQSLAAALKANPRPPLSALLRIGREIALGLAAAHEKGLIHRDIKPGNVWLEGSRLRVKILDFGLARPAATDDPAATEFEPLTGEGAIVGTPQYMSPEQARAQPVGPRTDLFSLGVVLYQMATGKLPFDGPTPTAVLFALATDHPTGLAEVDLPPALNALITRLLAKDEAGRPESAAEVVEELRRIEDALTARVRVVSLDAVPGAAAGPEPWAELDATEPDAPVVRTERRAAGGGMSKGWVAAGVLGLLVMVGAAWTAYKAVAPKPRPVEEAEAAKAAPKAPPPAPKPDYDRKAAETLLPYCDYIMTKNHLGTSYIKPDERLPRGPFTLTGIGFRQHVRGEPLKFPPDFTSTVLLPAIAELRELDAIFDNSFRVEMTEQELARLAELPCRTTLKTLHAWVELSPSVLDTLIRFPNLSHLAVSASQADETTLARLGGLAKLEKFYPAALGTKLPMTANGWKSVTNLPLKGLQFIGTPIEVSIARLIAAMPQLTVLSIFGGDVGDEALREIAGSSSVATLFLVGVKPVTDTGLDHLHKLTTLKSLRLQKLNVTKAGVDRLAAALPKCKIDWDGETVPPKK